MVWGGCYMWGDKWVGWYVQGQQHEPNGHRSLCRIAAAEVDLKVGCVAAVLACIDVSYSVKTCMVASGLLLILSNEHNTPLDSASKQDGSPDTWD